MSGPLAGTTILDLSRVLAGPWASQLLADYGAEVIKVERPGAGDDTRQWGPPWLTDDNGNATRESAYFLATNRNKKSITVDIATPQGQDIVRKLVAQCDVFIENFRVGTLQRYGLDASSLQALDSALIYCSITAYGQDGPRAQEAGYDAMIQASAGLMSLTGEPGRPPQKTGVAVADIMAGMYAATAILAALHARDRNGRGQAIDVPLFDTQLAWLANQGMNWLVGGQVPERAGNGHPNIVPYQSFATADGHLMLAVGNDRQFAACVACLGCAALADDSRFRTNSDRVRHRAELIRILADIFVVKATSHWLAVLGEHGIPCGPINNLEAAFGDPQVRAHNLVMHLPHALAQQVPTVANPVRFSQTATELRYAPPLLGQHTHEILRDRLGYSAQDIAVLEDAGAI